MKLKLITKQWSYSDELSGDLDKQLAKLKEEGATDIKTQLVATDGMVAMAITWVEKEEVVVVKAPAKK